MNKRIALAVAIAASLSAVSVPQADAGPFRDKLKSLASKVVDRGLTAAGCLNQVITNKKDFFCKPSR